MVSIDIVLQKLGHRHGHNYSCPVVEYIYIYIYIYIYKIYVNCCAVDITTIDL